MKKSNYHNSRIIWLFLFLSGLLFLAGLSSLFDLPYFKLNPLKMGKNDYQKLITSSQIKTEKLIGWLVFLNKKDGDIHLWLGDYFKNNNDFERANYYYQKVIEMEPLVYYEVYQEQSKVYEKLNKEKEAEDSILFLFGKIKNSGYLQGFSANLAKDFYSTGEKYLAKNDWQKTAFFWEKSTKISPEWSYFYLELASLYFNNGKLNQASRILRKCTQRKEPQDHCQQYLEDGMVQFENEKPGFWQEEILKIEGMKLD